MTISTLKQLKSCVLQWFNQQLWYLFGLSRKKTWKWLTRWLFCANDQSFVILNFSFIFLRRIKVNFDTTFTISRQPPNMARHQCISFMVLLPPPSPDFSPLIKPHFVATQRSTLPFRAPHDSSPSLFRLIRPTDDSSSERVAGFSWSWYDTLVDGLVVDIADI